jgi:hypothetical protein
VRYENKSKSHPRLLQGFLTPLNSWLSLNVSTGGFIMQFSITPSSILKCKTPLIFLAFSLLSAISINAVAAQEPARSFDARQKLTIVANPSSAVLSEVERFRNNNPDLMVRHNPKTGGVNSMFSLSQPLTAASNQRPADIARQFVENNRVLFGLDSGDVQESRISRDYFSSISGVTHITVQQQVNGLDVFDAMMIINITADGRVLKAGGALEKGLQRDQLAHSPLVPSADAVGKAATHAGVRKVLASDVDGLVYFRLSPSNLRLAWNLQIEDANSSFVYRTVVDALNGEVLLQYNTTVMDHFPAHGLAYTNDGPRPGTPSATIGGIVSRDDVPFSGAGIFGHNDPHYDWWDGGPRTTTTSNNVIAREDRDGDNETTLGFQPTALATENFNFVLDLTMEPEVEDGTVDNQSSAIVNLFYTNNWLHDVLYVYGFDEAAANFQTNNFGMNDAGNGDPVRADAQDKADLINDPDDGDNLCNANFNGCQADGNNPRMQMFVCDRTTPLLDGDLDNSVIAHEYGHGVHHRIIPTSCSKGYQGMGEGWGDYLAIALFAEPGDDINGEYNIGTWLGNLTTPSQTFRRQAYSTDQTVFTRTYADITDNAVCEVKLCSDEAATCVDDDGCNPGQTCDNQSCDFHFDCATPQQPFDLMDCKPETHNTGELWAEALWLARANLVIKYGFNVGSITMNTLVIEGMKVTSPQPDFLDARDGVLVADLAINAGVNQCLLWDAFARMGLGLSAQSVDDDDINPLEAFDTPAACTPNIDVSADLDFGDVCGDDAATTHMEIFNTGSGDLIIFDIERTAGSVEITLDENPELPLSIAAGSHVDFNLLCDGLTAGAKSATFEIWSNDADEPRIDLEFNCNTPEPNLNLSMADSGDFGEVCPLGHADLDLHLLNEGLCELTVIGINLNPIGSNYELPVIVDYPLVLAAGTDFTVPVRFEPNPGQACSNSTPRAATLTVLSNSPGETEIEVALQGLMPCPDLNVAIANSGDFGAVCATEQADLDLTLFNQGQCNLTIDDISSDNGLFELPDDITYPLVLSHDAEFTYPVRFSPTECSDDPATGILTIDSDSPGEEMLDIGISGSIPCPNLVIDPSGLTGDFAFPPTVMDLDGSLGCYTDRTTTVRNTGDCPLTIESISAADDFTVMRPSVFPIVLPSGEETLDVTVRFAPLSAGDPLAPDEFLGLLSIVSDDPDAVGEADLCGEGVAQSGVRVLATEISSGLPLPVEGVDNITLKSKGKKTPSPINLQFTDVPVQATSVCENTVAWHVDQETLPSAGTTGSNPKSSYQVSAREGNLQSSQSFNLGQCDFFEFQLQLLDSGSEDCTLLGKGEACTTAGECCSGKCKGPNGGKTCK